MALSLKTVLAAALLVGFGHTGNAQTTAPNDGTGVAPQAQSAPTATQKVPGQQGTISGTVLDQTQAAVPGAQVTLTAGTLGSHAVSGNNGQFSFSHVPAGRFQIRVEAKGFAPKVFAGELRAGQLSLLLPPILLPVAVSTTSVEVAPQEVIAERQLKEQEKQRVLGFIPNFYVTYLPNPAPLTARQKFRLATKVSFDPFTFGGVALLAGFQQAGNALPGYGQGLAGYAKRYGAAYGDALTGIYVGNAIFPSLLKQDPRFFYKGDGSKMSRLLYALASPVICKGDNGRWQPNYSAVLGGLAAGGVANLYYPAGDRNGIRTVVGNTGIRLAEDSFGAVLQEFLIPKLTPHLHHHPTMAKEPSAGTEPKQ